MTCVLPYWLQFLQAISLPVLAILGALIAALQWRTAHQRAAFDLFEKRWALIDELRNLMGAFLREGQATTEQALKFARRTHAAKFLFGIEVYDFLWGTYLKLIDHHAERNLGRVPGPNMHQHIEREHELLRDLTNFSEQLDLIVLPYLQMRQKVPKF